MTDQEAVEVMRAAVAAEPALDLVCRWMWEHVCDRIRTYEPPMRDLSEATYEQRVKQKQHAARRVYMQCLAAGDHAELAAARALDAIEVWA